MSNATRSQSSMAELEKKFEDKHEELNARLEQMKLGMEEIRNMLAQSLLNQNGGNQDSEGSRHRHTHTNRNSYSTRISKVEFPKFNGKNVKEWLYKCDQFFLLDGTPAESKVRLASIHLDGIALQWHLNYMRTKFDAYPPWQQYVADVVMRFGEAYEDPPSSLIQVKQTGRVQEYVDEFELALNQILKCLDQCSSNLKTIVSFGNVSTTQKKEAEELGASCFSWGEFLQLGNMDWDLPFKKKTDICTIMYTSGTTGEPKGVIIKNEAFMAEVLSVDQILLLTDRVATEDDVYFSFLPLAHVYDQIMETYCISKGSSIGFWQGDVRFLMEDVQTLKPTIFCGVPRVFDRVYAGINTKISSGGALRSTLFQYAYNYKLGHLEKGFPQDKAAPLFDRLVFDKIKQALGGRVRLLLSGAAPLPRHVEEFLRVTCGCTLSQGYGLTESCSGCFTAIADVFSMMGTVGVPMPTIEARLESVPEMGYDALSTEARGEICLRGSTLFSGYHKRQDLTEEVLVDGWFHTGDIGEWQPNGAMKIIDRKKNIFKLSQGEYVAVENIENKYLQCPLITSIWVYGNSFESFLVAVVVPERNTLEDWAVKHNLTDDFKSLCENLKARKYILDELNSTGQKHQLRGFELLKAVHLEPIPFDMDRDLITPTFKLKRPQLLKHYKDYIDQLYKEGKGKIV